MSRFLGNIAARAMGQASVVQPRPRSRHEDAPLGKPFQDPGPAGENAVWDPASDADVPDGTRDAGNTPLAAEPASPPEKSYPSPGFIRPRETGGDRLESETRSEDQHELSSPPSRSQDGFALPVTENPGISPASDRFSEPIFSDPYPISPLDPVPNADPVSHRESAGPWFASDPDALRDAPTDLVAPVPSSPSRPAFSAHAHADSRQAPSQPKELVVQVRIGRIEVKAQVDPAPKPAPAPARASGVSLQQYLARRNGDRS